MNLKVLNQLLESLNINPDEIEDERYLQLFAFYYYGSAEGHEYPDL